MAERPIYPLAGEAISDDCERQIYPDIIYREERNMKAMKTMVLVIMAVSVVASLSLGTAHAAAIWLNHATVNSVGPASGKVSIKLTDSTSTPPVDHIWYYAAAAQDKEILATALTAMSLNKEVKVKLTDPAAGSSVINIYLNE
jgi:hypothetical protein